MNHVYQHSRMCLAMGPKLEGFVKSNHTFMVTFNNVIITMLLSI